MRTKLLPFVLAFLTSNAGTVAFAHPEHHDGWRHESNHHRPRYGQVLVTNDAGTPIDVTLTSGAGVHLQPGERTLLRAPVGATAIRATYEVLGQSVVLEEEHTFVQRDRVARVRIEPEDEAFVRVTNRTGTTGDLFVDSRFVATLTPGASFIASVEPGKTRLEIIDPGGKSLDRGRVATAVYAPTTWTANRPVQNGTLTMSSEVAIPTTVYVDGRRAGEMAPNGSLRTQVTPGYHEVAVVDARGRTVETRSVWIEPGRTQRVEADGERSVAFVDGDGEDEGRWANEHDRRDDRDEHRDGDRENHRNDQRESSHR